MLFLGRWMATPKPPPIFPPESLVVAVLPVGQGEASWIRTPDDHFIVIGCGPDIGGRELANSLRSLGAQRIDLLILPTPYRESLGGVPDLVRAFPITMAYDNGWVEPLNQAHRAAFRSLGEKGIPIYSAEAGQKITIGEGTLEFLHPSEPRIMRSPEAGNNAVVVRLTWGKTAFHWAGGLERGWGGVCFRKNEGGLEFCTTRELGRHYWGRSREGRPVERSTIPPHPRPFPHRGGR